MLTQRRTTAAAIQEYANKLNELYINDSEKSSRFIAIRKTESGNKSLTAYLTLSSKFITQLNLLKSQLDASNPAPGTVLAILNAVGKLVYTESLQEFESTHAEEVINDDRMILLELLHDTVSATSQYYSNPRSNEKFDNLKKATEAFAKVQNSVLAPRNHRLQVATGKGYLAALSIFLTTLAFIGIVGTATPTLPMLFLIKAFGQVSGVVLGICEAAMLSSLYASGDHFFNSKYRNESSRVSNNANVFFKAAEELREPQPNAENEQRPAFLHSVMW